MWVISSGKKLNRQIWCVTGLLPWNAVPGKACGMTLSAVCKTREVKNNPRRRNISIKQMRFTHCRRSSPISTRWPTASTSRPSPARASLSWHWWVVLPFGLLFRGCRGSCDTVPLWVEALKHPRLPLMTGKQFALCSAVFGYHRTSTMLQQCADRAWVDARLVRKTDFVYVQFHSAHISFLSCNGWSLFFILSSPVFLHVLSLLVPPLADLYCVHHL